MRWVSHVATINKVLDEIRVGEWRQIASEGGVPVLKKSRWLLLQREENLNPIIGRAAIAEDSLRKSAAPATEHIVEPRVWPGNHPR